MESKTYAFGNEGTGGNNLLGLLAPLLQQSGVDPNVLLAMKNNGNGMWCGEGGWFMWVIFLFFLMGWGEDGQSAGCLRGQEGNGQDKELQPVHDHEARTGEKPSVLCA